MKIVLSLFAMLAWGMPASPAPQYPPSGPAQAPPGQYPGGYPPGQGPGGGIPVPTRNKKQKSSAVLKQPTITAQGITLTNDGKKLVFHTDDGRTITASLLPLTTWTRAGSTVAPTLVQRGALISVVMAEDDEAYLTAISVDYLKEPAVSAPEPVKSGAEPPKELTDQDLTSRKIIHEDAPGRPRLRRQAPKELPKAEVPAAGDADNSSPAAAAPKESLNVDFTIDSDSPAAARHTFGSELLDRATQWTTTFTQKLPNYVCQQVTTRFSQMDRSEDWRAQDVVTAKVVYEDGNEKYQGITVGGKKTNKSMMEIGGTTSTGEFASMLASLFDPARETEFKFVRSTTIHDAEAVIYSFKVLLPRSDWTIIAGGQTLRPEYSGSIYVDKKTAQVRRLEMGANKIPKDFPFEAMESAIDYDEISLGTNKYLLPVHAENLACERSSPICSKNTIDFRDYHRYTGEGTVTFP